MIIIILILESNKILGLIIAGLFKRVDLKNKNEVQ
jgi:hypothetical protein